MSKLKHTPGPWEIKQDDRGYFENIGPLSMGFTHADDVWLDIAESDARLIAAAPEMLEALIIEAKNQVIRIPSIKNIDEFVKNVGKTKIMQIIEKATGLTIEEILNEN